MKVAFTVALLLKGERKCLCFGELFGRFLQILFSLEYYPRETKTGIHTMTYPRTCTAAHQSSHKLETTQSQNRLFFSFSTMLCSFQAHSTVVRQSHTLQSVSPNVSSIYLAPHVVILVLLTVFPMLHFVSP